MFPCSLNQESCSLLSYNIFLLLPFSNKTPGLGDPQFSLVHVLQFLHFTSPHISSILYASLLFTISGFLFPHVSQVHVISPVHSSPVQFSPVQSSPILYLQSSHNDVISLPVPPSSSVRFCFMSLYPVVIS